ncbi:MAG: type IV pilus assembly protein PilM [Candidatus Komeilibacteria bacterium]
MTRLNNFFTLDISDFSLEAIECQRDFWGRVQVKNVSRVRLDAGIIVNGEIKNANALVKAFKELLSHAKPGPINSRHCLLSIPENRVFTHIFQAPLSLAHDEVDDFVLHQAEGIIPFNKETIYSDYQIVAKDDKSKTIMYAAAPQALIQGILNILKRLGINVLLVELESLSQARALLPRLSTNQAAMLVDMGGNYSNITIHDKEGMRLTVSLPVAGNTFTDIVRRRAGLTKAKAEDAKIKIGLSGSDSKVKKALQEALTQVISEIKRSIDYYQQQSGRKVKEIIMLGGSAKLPGLADYLHKNIDLPVHLGNPWHRVRKSKAVLKIWKQGAGTFYSSAIGLIIRASRKNYRSGFNLISYSNRGKKILPLRRTGEKIWPKLLILLLLIIIFCGIIIWRDELKPAADKPTAAVVEVLSSSFVISYADNAVKDLAIPRLRGSLQATTGEASVPVGDLTIDDLPDLAPDSVYLVNDSDQEVTVVSGSRLSLAGEDQIYYLSSSERLIPGDRVLGKIITADDQPARLQPGHYNFLGLTVEQQEKIYAEKNNTLDAIDPSSAAQIDLNAIASAQSQLQVAIMQAAQNKLPGDIVYVQQPLITKVTSWQWVVGDDMKTVYLRGQIEYQWLVVQAEDILDLANIEWPSYDWTTLASDLVKGHLSIVQDNKTEQIAEVKYVVSVIR